MKMRTIIIAYIGIVLAVCVDEMMILKDVLITLVGITPQLHVSIVTDNSVARIATKLI